METKQTENKLDSIKKEHAEMQKNLALVKEAALSMMPQEALEIVKKAKAEGIQPYAAQIGEEWFIYRVLNRLEYRMFMTESAKSAEVQLEGAESQTSARILINLKNEEAMVERCVLYPEINKLTIPEIKAGYIETLYNTIMSTSGFGLEPMPIKL